MPLVILELLEFITSTATNHKRLNCFSSSSAPVHPSSYAVNEKERCMYLKKTVGSLCFIYLDAQCNNNNLLHAYLSSLPMNVKIYPPVCRELYLQYMLCVSYLVWWKSCTRVPEETDAIARIRTAVVQMKCIKRCFNAHFKWEDTRCTLILANPSGEIMF